MNALLTKDAKYEWTNKCQQAFTTLMAKLVSAKVLAYPSMTQEFILTTDASTTAMGYILSQKIEVKEHPIARFVLGFGRATRESEKNYSITDLECLAILEGVYAYRLIPYRHSNIYTDHSALTCVKK